MSGKLRGQRHRTRPAPLPARHVREFPNAAAFVRKCQDALHAAGHGLSRDAVTVTVQYHGHVPVGHRLLFLQVPERVWATATGHLPDGTTLCTVPAQAIVHASPQYFRSTHTRPVMSTVHPLPARQAAPTDPDDWLLANLI